MRKFRLQHLTHQSDCEQRVEPDCRISRNSAVSICGE